MIRWARAVIGTEGTGARRLVASSLWSGLLRVGGALVTFLVGLQLARYLGPAGFGIYGIILGVAMLLAAVAQLGLPTLAMREIVRARTAGDWPGLRGVLRWFMLAAAGLGALLAGLFALTVLVVPDVSREFLFGGLWAAPLIPVTACFLLLSAELRAFDRLLKGQSLEILVRPAGMAVMLFAVMAMQGAITPAGALAVNLAASALAMAIGFFWLRQAIPDQVRQARPDRNVRAWLGAALPLTLTDILRNLDTVYGVLVMGVVATAAETGVYRVAASSIVIVATPLSVLHVVLAPTLARLYFERERGKLQRLVGIAAIVMLASALAGTAVVAVAGEWLIAILFGAEYAGAWLPLLLLCIAQSVGAFFGVAFVMLGVAEGEGDLARAFVISVATSVAAAIPLAILWGATGVAVAAVIGALVNNGLAWHAVRRRMAVDASPFGLLRSSA